MLDSEKLFKLLINDPDIRNIPIATIMRVTLSVIKAINGGECFTKWEE